MTDSTSQYPYYRNGLRHGTFLAALACLVLWLCLALTALTADPVAIVVSGIKGDALKNVQESLILPAGLVREGTVCGTLRNQSHMAAILNMMVFINGHPRIIPPALRVYPNKIRMLYIKHP